MFHLLHRLYVLAWVGLVIGSMGWFYPRTGLTESARDWYAVWQNGPSAKRVDAGVLEGQVVRVLDGASFTLMGSERQSYNIGLAGVIAPSVRKAEPGKARLAELILSRNVQVRLASIDPQHRGLGVVYTGSTNVNAVLVESGLVQIKREFIRPLPLKEQYALLRADRLARSRKLSASE